MRSSVKVKQRVKMKDKRGQLKVECDKHDGVVMRRMVTITHVNDTS